MMTRGTHDPAFMAASSTSVDRYPTIIVPVAPTTGPGLHFPYPITHLQSLDESTALIRTTLNTHLTSTLDLLRKCAHRSAAASLLAHVATPDPARASTMAYKFASPAAIVAHVPRMTRAATTDPSILGAVAYYRNPRAHKYGARIGVNVRALLHATSHAGEAGAGHGHDAHERAAFSEVLTWTLWDAIAEVRDGRLPAALPSADRMSPLFKHVHDVQTGRKVWELETMTASRPVSSGFAYLVGEHGLPCVYGVSHESRGLFAAVKEEEAAAGGNVGWADQAPASGAE